MESRPLVGNCLIATAGALLALLVLAQSASAQSFQVLVDFGSPEGQQPKSGLVQTSDGSFWGTTAAGGIGHGTIFKLSPTDQLTTVYVFNGTPDGRGPEATLLLAADGRLYGSTHYGGAANKGTLFQINPATGALVKLRSFSGADGAEPVGKLVQAADGKIYGTTVSGGTSNFGTVFRVDTSGAGFSTLRSFTGTNGKWPFGGVVQGLDSFFYGTALAGGASNYGTVFRMDLAGNLTTLHAFNSTNGASPTAGLVQGIDGNLYGVASSGALGYGAIFRISTSGVFSLLKSFSGNDGFLPDAELIEAPDGNLYGTTKFGGAMSAGVIFKISKAGAYTLLRSLSSATDGANPDGALIVGTDAWLHGTTSAGGPPGAAGTIFEIATSGGNFAVNYAFKGSPAAPNAALTPSGDGGFYGTSMEGGAYSKGTLFKVTEQGDVQLLHAFNTEAAIPLGSVIVGSDGALYGTTFRGPTNPNLGTVFKKPLSGPITVLKVLTSGPTGTGNNPQSGLVQAADGNYYGVTSGGGAAGFGTLFKVSAAGAWTTLLSFTAGTGLQPYGGLIEASNGLLYGTTSGGGPNGYGTLYSFDPVTKVLTVHHSFGGPDGANPYGEVIQSSDGRLYGITQNGGANGAGAIYRFDPSTAMFTTVYSLKAVDGTASYARLVEKSGLLYGTTFAGGQSNYGTVFSFNPASVMLTVMHSFSGSDGASSRAGLAEGTDGALYGVTTAGGAKGNGVIFRVAASGPPPPPPPPPPVGGSITVTNPNTAVTWTIGSSRQIQWNHTLAAGSTVRIEVSRDGGQTWSLIAPLVPASSGGNGNNGSYTWTVTGPATTAARIRVSAEIGTATDDSDVNFTIAGSPR